jgi:hypothetical protein
MIPKECGRLLNPTRLEDAVAVEKLNRVAFGKAPLKFRVTSVSPSRRAQLPVGRKYQYGNTELLGD